VTGRPFSVDIPGLLEALTQQFPEPLLCVRELVQNAADAGSTQIRVDLAYDRQRGLFRLSVSDDGRGMSAAEVESYLTIGLSHKGPDQRGRFGIGKLSPYALGITRMVVETSEGTERHRLVFAADGSGTVLRAAGGPSGTVVRVYKAVDRGAAQRLAQRTFEIVRDHCGGLELDLRVNGVAVRRRSGPGSRYTWRFESPDGQGALGLQAEPVYQLVSGGILLESGTSLFGEGVSYSLDSTALSPNLSRNAVRRDQAFEALVRRGQEQLTALAGHVGNRFASRVESLRVGDLPVEARLDADDRAALEWLRARVMDSEGDERSTDDAPVLETADGSLVAPADLLRLGKSGSRIPVSRVPRSRDELRGYIDRGLPVLLLYRDVEDFLERRGLVSSEVDALDLGDEVPPSNWTAAERALADSPGLARPPSRPAVAVRPWVGLAAAAAGCFALAYLAGDWWITHRNGFEAEWARRLAIDGGTVDAGAGGGESTGWPWTLGITFLTFVLGAGVLARAVVQHPQWRARFHVFARALWHPRDFLAARFWSRRSEGPRVASPGDGLHVAEPDLVASERLDLDSVQLGFIDLRSAGGEDNEARVLLFRDGRVLLNRNHPTVRHLVVIAQHERARARMLLEALLATDPVLARRTDPRQAEWDLLARNQVWVRIDQ
jgi:hypothetical protein